jgi:hypothetical protein
MEFSMILKLFKQSNQLINLYFWFQKFTIDNECIIFKK